MHEQKDRGPHLTSIPLFCTRIIRSAGVMFRRGVWVRVRGAKTTTRANEDTARGLRFCRPIHLSSAKESVRSATRTLVVCCPPSRSVGPQVSVTHESQTLSIGARVGNETHYASAAKTGWQKHQQRPHRRRSSTRAGGYHTSTTRRTSSSNNSNSNSKTHID